MKKKFYQQPQVKEIEIKFSHELLVLSAREGYQNGGNGWEEMTNEMMGIPQV